MSFRNSFFMIGWLVILLGGCCCSNTNTIPIWDKLPKFMFKGKIFCRRCCLQWDDLPSFDELNSDTHDPSMIWCSSSHRRKTPSCESETKTRESETKTGESETKNGAWETKTGASEAPETNLETETKNPDWNCNVIPCTELEKQDC